MDTRFLDSLTATLTKTAKELTQKGESLYDKQKIRLQAATEQQAANKALAAIGKVIYDRYTAGEELEEALADLCVEAKNHFDKIDALNSTIAAKSTKKVCPACGKAMPKNAMFCSSCGAAFPEEPVVEEEIIDAEDAEIADAAEEITDIAEDLNKMADEIDSAAEEVVEAAGEVAEKAADEVAGAVEEVKDAVESIIEKITEE